LKEIGGGLKRLVCEGGQHLVMTVKKDYSPDRRLPKGGEKADGNTAQKGPETKVQTKECSSAMRSRGER